MSCTQAGFLLPKLEQRVPCRTCSLQSLNVAHASYLNVCAIPEGKTGLSFPRLNYEPLRSRRGGVVCMAKGDSTGGSEEFSWDSLKKAMGGMRQEPSIQSWIKEQMSKQESDGNGGDGCHPEGGGDGPGAGGEEDGSILSILDEVLQFIMGTIGFIFVYIYLIRGPELSRLFRDYIKYLFGVSPSLRLRKAIWKWGKFYRKLTVRRSLIPDWLERKIICTPTWLHKPKRLARLTRRLLKIQGYKVAW